MSTGPRSDSAAAGLARAGRIALGLGLIAGCFLAGDWAKQRFGLILPGSVLGLFLLLALLLTGLVRLAWVEEAARLLLFLMPMFFVPIYVAGTADRALWREWGGVMAGVLTVTVALLWLFAGRLAQRLLGPEEAAGPKP